MATAMTIRRIEVEEFSAHLATLEQELTEVESIELVRGKTVIAELKAKQMAEPFVEEGDSTIPDFRAQMRAVFGDRVLDTDGAALIREDRDARG